MNPSLTRRAFVLLVSAFGVVSLLAAEDVGGFTGYTRPGWPADVKTGEGIVFAADNPEVRDRAIGGSVYFTVLELTSKAGDSWGSGLERFNSTFKAGIDFNGTSSPALDTSARYLYLYQVVNDRRTPTPIYSLSVKLIVEPADVTSWGHFDGVGFGVPVRAEKQAATDGQIRPVSFNNMLLSGALDKLYKSPASYVLPGNKLVLSRVPTKLGEEAPKDKDDQRVVRVVWDALDPALNPNHVMMLHISDFNQGPAFRAVWSSDNGIKKDVRSTVFGFTSNWPPTYEAARLRGLRIAKVGGDIKPAADKGAFKEEAEQMDAAEGMVGAEGKVPTPRPDRPVVTGGAASTGNKGFVPSLTNFSSGGQPAVPAIGGGGGGTGGGLGNGNGSGAGGFLGSGGGSGRTTTVVQGSTTTSAQQAGNQNQNLVFNPIIINDQAQLQSQFQQQRQQQQQSNSNNNSNNNRNHGHGIPSEVVPQPEGFWLAAVGLPVLVLLVLRRRMKAEVA